MPRHTLTVNDTAGGRPPRRLLEAVLKKTLTLYGRELNQHASELSLVVVGDSEMTKLNKERRGKGETTNVLSFSYIKPDRKKASAEPRILGEIVISSPQVTLGAKQFKNSRATEMALLFLHGLLHIIRFDHEKGSTASRKMRLAEDTVISRIPVLRRAVHGGGLLGRNLMYPKGVLKSS